MSIFSCPGLPIFADAVLDYFSNGTVTGVQIEQDDLPLHLKYVHEHMSMHSQKSNEVRCAWWERCPGRTVSCSRSLRLNIKR